MWFYFLCSYGFHDVWLTQSVNNVEIFIHELKQSIKATFIADVNAFFNNSSKCILYRYIYIYDTGILQFYLDRPVDQIYKTFICKYRISAHSLKIETGRYCNVDKENRLCTLCNNKIVEDEYHVILECNRYSDVRKLYIVAISSQCERTY